MAALDGATTVFSTYMQRAFPGPRAHILAYIIYSGALKCPHTFSPACTSIICHLYTKTILILPPQNINLMIFSCLKKQTTSHILPLFSLLHQAFFKLFAVSPVSLKLLPTTHTIQDDAKAFSCCTGKTFVNRKGLFFYLFLLICSTMLTPSICLDAILSKAVKMIHFLNILRMGAHVLCTHSLILIKKYRRF